MPIGCDVKHNPTPEEIARVCAEIREEWSERRWETQRTTQEREWLPMVAKEPQVY